MDIQVVASGVGGESRALQLQFSGARVAGFTVGQFMLLQPGEYRFTGRVRTEDLRTERGIRWQISCAEPPDTVLVFTDLAVIPMPWTDFGVKFTVLAKDCDAQRLNLEIPSRTASERRIEGQIWYENLKIERVAKGQPPGMQ
jgi:hypothetical protein